MLFTNGFLLSRVQMSALVNILLAASRKKMRDEIDDTLHHQSRGNDEDETVTCFLANSVVNFNPPNIRCLY